jgi:hypothetical protein
LIPTIETIVEDLASGLITKQQAIAWLHAHAEDAGSDLRDHFATHAMQGMLANKWNQNYPDWAEHAYKMADAMLAARSA